MNVNRLSKSSLVNWCWAICVAYFLISEFLASGYFAWIFCTISSGSGRVSCSTICMKAGLVMSLTLNVDMKSAAMPVFASVMSSIKSLCFLSFSTLWMILPMYRYMRLTVLYGSVLKVAASVVGSVNLEKSIEYITLSITLSTAIVGLSLMIFWIKASRIVFMFFFVYSSCRKPLFAVCPSLLRI